VTGVIISKKVVILYWTKSIDDLKFKMKEVIVQLKKLVLREGINRRKVDSYQPPAYFPEFKNSIVIQSVF
jgi:hypothetical protein